MKKLTKISIGLVVVVSLWISYSLGRWMSGSASHVLTNTEPHVDKRSAFPDSANIRWIKNEDGTYSIFNLLEKKQMTKRVIKKDGRTAYVASYRLDDEGRELGCKISDADGRSLYKVSFGYRKSNGKLVEERVFQDDGADASEVLCRVLYDEDDKGTQTAPIFIAHDNAREGITYTGIPAAMSMNPFADDFRASNPH